MNFMSFARWGILAGTVVAAGVGLEGVAHADGQSVQDISGNGTYWRIDQPIVTEAQTAYPQIRFNPGDDVYFRAGGCVQTGGRGKTWKRYVNPSGPNSASLYHGEIQIPGAFNTPTFLSYLIGSADDNGGAWAGHVTVDPQYNNWPVMYLTLGYTDDGYGDNGYWGHDDGTDDQCKGIGDAWIEVYIVHH